MAAALMTTRFGVDAAFMTGYARRLARHATNGGQSPPHIGSCTRRTATVSSTTATRAALRSVLCLCAALAAANAGAQTTQPAWTPQQRELLDKIEDFSFNFGQPGFYTILERALAEPSIAPDDDAALEIADWSELLERPADFRGAAITITGVVGRSKAWRHTQPRFAKYGVIHQLELSRRGAPLACTLIMTESAAGIPIGATIRVSGYFVMIRQYRDSRGNVHQAALLVGHGPTLISQAVPRSWRFQKRGAMIIIASIVGGLLLAWIVLRRFNAAARREARLAQADHPAPAHLADDLQKWAAREMPDDADPRDADGRRP